MKQHQLFVSPTGNDTHGVGSKEKPWATLKTALRAARNIEGKREIVLRDGTYFLPEPVVLGSEDSGVTLCAFETERPCLTGAVSLNASVWQPYTPVKNAWVTQIQTGLPVDMLFVNGVPQIPARYPNQREGVVPLGGAVSTVEIKARCQRWKKPETGRVRAIHAYGWGGNDYLVQGRDAQTDTGLALKWVGDNNRGSGLMDTTLVAENIFEELDAPQEWFYDAQQGLLYYVAPEEMCPGDPKYTFTLAVNAELVRISGANAENPVHDITIQGLDFTQTARTLFSGKPYLPLQRGDWAVVKSGAVYVENARQVVLRDVTFTHIGGNAIFFYGYNTGHCIEQSEFLHMGASGVQIVGDAAALWQPSYWPHDHYPEHPGHQTQVTQPNCSGPAAECYPRNIVLRQNHMMDIGVWEKQSAGVNLSVAANVCILHCTIHHSARSCININDGSFGGHEIAYNDIFDAQTETMDHGPFNSWGRDRFWSVPEYHGGGDHGECMRHYHAQDSHVYDITLLDACATTRIHNNRFHHMPTAPHTWGIDLDDGSSNYEIYQNLCLGMGIKLREGFSRRVYNNILVDGRLEIHVPYAQARDTVFSNLILCNEPFSFVGADAVRYRRSETELAGNWYYNFGVPVTLPDWILENDAAMGRCTVKDANPLLRDTAHNDYTVQNIPALEKSGFHNFPMDGFGKQGCAFAAPHYEKKEPTAATGKIRREAWEGAFLSEIDNAVISATGSFGTQGVYFEVVPSQCEAFRIGFRSRDVLKELDGKLVEDLRNFYNQAGKLHGEHTAIIHRTNHPQALKLNW